MNLSYPPLSLLSIKNKLGKALEKHPKPNLSLSGYTPSAVLVPLFMKKNKFHLLLTKRSLAVKAHKGQIAFPGGVYERKDRSLLTTALRETEEEIGLERSQVEILGELGEIYTPTRYRIHPFVGFIPYPCALKINRCEIESLVEVPLHHLLKQRHLRYETVEFFDSTYDTPYFRYKEHTIWGATGKITRELIVLFKALEQ